jgi:hypothetical protein
MEEAKFVRWVELPEAQPVRFDALPGLMACALHEVPIAQAAAEVNLEIELRALVDLGVLMVRDPLTLGRHTFPLGAALRRAVLLPREDLRPLLASRGIGLRLTPFDKGGGTQSKLTDEQRATIGARITRGETASALAREYGVSRRTIDKCKPAPKPTSAAWPVVKKRVR